MIHFNKIYKAKINRKYMGIERIFKGVLGLLFILGAVYLLVRWFEDVAVLVLGGIPFVLGLIGLVFIMLSFEK